MTLDEKIAILNQLLQQPGVESRGRLWVPRRPKKGRQAGPRIYLQDSIGAEINAYICVDMNGDLFGLYSGPKLSRSKNAQVWGTWSDAASYLGRRLSTSQR